MTSIVRTPSVVKAPLAVRPVIGVKKGVAAAASVPTGCDGGLLTTTLCARSRESAARSVSEKQGKTAACLLVSYRPLATRSLNARGALEAAPRGDTPSN